MRTAFVLLVILVATFTTAQNASSSTNSPVVLNNSSLHLEFDLEGGTVVHWRLPGIEQANGALCDLAAPAGRMFALGGSLAGRNLHTWEKQVGGWVLHERGPDSLTLRLQHPEKHFTIDKTWTLHSSSWRAAFQISFNGLQLSDQDQLWLELGPGIGETPAQGLGMAQTIYSFTEVVYRDDDGVQHVRLKDQRPSVSFGEQEGPSEWVGMQSRYFAMVLSPVDDATRTLDCQARLPDSPVWHAGNLDFETILRISLPLASGQAEPLVYSWEVYGGGKAYDALKAAEPDLSNMLFSGLWNWMRALTLGIMHVLNAIYAVVGNWGLSIILLAVLVRLMMYPIAKKAMAAQKHFVDLQEKIQPELDHIKETYQGGEQSEHILQLYAQHNTSPFAGLRPLLIVMLQIPVFVALYHLIGQAFALRSEPFMWMATLAEPDQLFGFGVDLPFFGAYFNLLPALMALTNIASIKLSPTPTTSGKASFRQNVMLTAMALIFFLLFYSFPSGMVLYWATANILQITHQKVKILVTS